MIIWQDVVITVVQIVLIIALLPVVRADASKPPKATSFSTAVALGVMVIPLLSLHLWISSFMIFLACMIWGLIAYRTH